MKSDLENTLKYSLKLIQETKPFLMTSELVTLNL